MPTTRIPIFAPIQAPTGIIALRGSVVAVYPGAAATSGIAARNDETSSGLKRTVPSAVTTITAFRRFVMYEVQLPSFEVLKLPW